MILLAPDKFKGTYSAAEIVQMLRKEIVCTNPCEQIMQVPLADGGEGSLEAFMLCNSGAERVWVSALDPLMREIEAPMAVCGDTVFIEMACSCGLMMIDIKERNPLRTTTSGLGLMLLAALDYSPRRIIVGLGGSATNDGGRGMVEAVGLENLRLFEGIEILAACDVTSPLLGPQGATAVFAPQKGADKEMLKVLEERMRSWSATAAGWLASIGLAERAEDFATLPGAGAAGGVGAALHAFFGAKIVSGSALFADMANLPQMVSRSRLVISGEGSLDASSLCGKLVGNLAQLCAEKCRPLYVVCGRNSLGRTPLIRDVATLSGEFKEKIAAWCRRDWRSDYLPQQGLLFSLANGANAGTDAGTDACANAGADACTKACASPFGAFSGAEASIASGGLKSASSSDRDGALINPLYGIVAGCDEAGRGPLAGPVYAAAVILPEGFYHPLLKDSKKMTASQRELMCGIIEREALAWSVQSVSPAEIDEINILQASIKAMKLSLEDICRRCGIRPDLILVDGNRFSPFTASDGSRIPHKCVVKGDDKVPEISAASILAKTYRDRYMLQIDKEYPQYGWSGNMGYPTKEHRDAIRVYGLSPYHRKSFKARQS